MPPAGWKEQDWAELLACMRRRRVVPIVGEELLQVEIDGQRAALYPWIATRLAESLGVAPGASSLNDVVCSYLSRGDATRNPIYTNISMILDEARSRLVVPTPLRQLAEITDFSLFVSTTFDSLLERALAEVRRKDVETLAYSPGDPQDLAPQRSVSQPVVYHLLGIADVSPTYAVSREDLLEWIHALEAQRRPNNLFDELKKSYLLVLGDSFTDWLPWFFRLRLDKRLSDSRDAYEYVADSRVADHPDLVFLRHFSKQTKRCDGGAVQFVEELWRRWKQARPAPGTAAAAEPVPLPAELPKGALFISYASEDGDAARNLHAGLSAAGFEGWYDKKELQGGDAFGRKILDNISHCSYFLPVISRNSIGQHDRYFIREWNCAIERAQQFIEGDPFIVPVVIDDTDIGRAKVPLQFMNTQVFHLPHGEVTAEFRALIRKLKAARP